VLELALRKKLGQFRLEAEVTTASHGVLALFGRSGAGKTTLVNMLAGLVRPDSGYIVLDGHRLFDSSSGIDVAPEHRGLGYVFQEGRLFPHLNVRSNLLYGHRRARANERFADLSEIVELLDIGHLLARRPATLSAGEKQRVAIGRALLSHPRLLLLDEPLAALDVERKSEVLPFIERLRDELRRPIVYVSHDPLEVLRLADRVLLLEQGAILAAGSVSAVFSQPELQRLVGAAEAGAVLTARVDDHDENFELTRLRFGAGGRLVVPRVAAPVESELRLRIRARDVAIAKTRPEEISILNSLPARVIAIHPPDGPYREVELLSAESPLWARITARSVQDLALAVGDEVFALVKAVSIDRQAFSTRPVR
jgi:molybdate transport system ATP-binding protein